MMMMYGEDPTLSFQLVDMKEKPIEASNDGNVESALEAVPTVLLTGDNIHEKVADYIKLTQTEQAHNFDR